MLFFQPSVYLYTVEKKDKKQHLCRFFIFLQLREKFMNHKNNRRVQMTKKLLEDALLKLLTTHNINDISICELCKTADLNRSTFYKYYNSPHELFEEMKHNVLEQARQIFSETSSCSYKEQIIQLLYFSLEHEQFSKLVFANNLDPNLPNLLFHNASDEDHILKNMTGSSPNEILYKQEFYFYGVYQVINRWINKEQRETPEQIAEIIMQFTTTNLL